MKEMKKDERERGALLLAILRIWYHGVTFSNSG